MSALAAKVDHNHVRVISGGRCYTSKYLFDLAESIDRKYLDLHLRSLVYALHLHGFQNRSPAVTASHDFILWMECIKITRKDFLEQLGRHDGTQGVPQHTEHRGSHAYMEDPTRVPPHCVQNPADLCYDHVALMKSRIGTLLLRTPRACYYYQGDP